MPSSIGAGLPGAVGALDRYHKKDTLASDRVRAMFLLPDRLAEP